MNSELLCENVSKECMYTHSLYLLLFTNLKDLIPFAFSCLTMTVCILTTLSIKCFEAVAQLQSDLVISCLYIYRYKSIIR